MGYITKRCRKNGQVSYRAQVRIRRGDVTHNESATFGKRSLASAWIKRKEGALAEPGALEVAQAPTDTVGDLVRDYITRYREVLDWGRNKQKTLEQIQRQPIADLKAAALTGVEIVDYVRSRRAEGAGPSTVDAAVTWLHVVFEAARSDGMPIDPAIIDEARKSCRQKGLLAPARRRDRRPAKREMERLYEWFDYWQFKAKVPMCEIVRFAATSSRRRDEIVRLRWDDNDPKTRTGLVRDAKHPRRKRGNHKRFKYTKEAWAIVQRQPKTSAFIFPYKGSAITSRFVRACKRLDIADLRFHDLRHEATSRLFEAGGTITEVQQYTLHESWDVLRRYTQLRPEDVRQF